MTVAVRVASVTLESGAPRTQVHTLSEEIARGRDSCRNANERRPDHVALRFRGSATLVLIQLPEISQVPRTKTQELIPAPHRFPRRAYGDLSGRWPLGGCVGPPDHAGLCTRSKPHPPLQISADRHSRRLRQPPNQSRDVGGADHREGGAMLPR
jgi:hypothetical protein